MPGAYDFSSGHRCFVYWLGRIGVACLSFRPDNEFDLSEQVFSERSVGVADEQLPGGADSFDDALGLALPWQAVGVPFAQPVHPGAVVALQGFLVALAELFVAEGEAFEERSQDFFAVERASGQLRHRHRVGQRRVECGLVDVDSYAHDTPRQGRARAVVLDQHPHYLAVSGVDIVRPLDAGRDAVVREHVGQGQRHGFREQELFAYGQELRFEHQRERQVFALGAVPHVAALAPARRLPFGPYHVAVTVSCVAGFVVGRRRRGKTVNH